MISRDPKSLSITSSLTDLWQMNHLTSPCGTKFPWRGSVGHGAYASDRSVVEGKFFTDKPPS